MSKKALSDIMLQFVWGYAIIWHNETDLSFLLSYKAVTFSQKKYIIIYVYIYCFI